MTEDEFAERERLTYQADLLDISGRDSGVRFFRRLFQGAGCLEPVTDTSARVYRSTAVQAFGMMVWRDLHAVNPGASTAIFDALMRPEPGTHDDNQEDDYED